MSSITPQDIQNAVTHWLTTPVGTYLGSFYGFDKYDILMRPNSTAAANNVLSKLRKDVLLLQAVPQNAINLYGEPGENGTMNLFIEVIGQLIPIDLTP